MIFKCIASICFVLLCVTKTMGQDIVSTGSVASEDPMKVTQTGNMTSTDKNVTTEKVSATSSGVSSSVNSETTASTGASETTSSGTEPSITERNDTNTTVSEASSDTPIEEETNSTTSESIVTNATVGEASTGTSVEQQTTNVITPSEVTDTSVVPSSSEATSAQETNYTGIETNPTDATTPVSNVSSDSTATNQETTSTDQSKNDTDSASTKVSNDTTVPEESSSTIVVSGVTCTSASTTQSASTSESSVPTPADNRTTACQDQPCRNGGTCRLITSADYECNCLPGFVGVNCETTDRCEKNGAGILCGIGACVYSEDRSSKHCKCFSGKHWDADLKDCREIQEPCFPNPCANGGTCEDQSDGVYKCLCADGFSGSTCEDHCGKDHEGKVCGNGECVEVRAGRPKHCHCAQGLYANSETHTCQPANPPCEPDPCNGHGQCDPVSEEAYNCTCDSWHFGSNCENLNHCPLDGEGGRCKNGQCVLSETDAVQYCKCNTGFALQEFTGECKEIVKPCFPNPCENGGVCDSISETEFNCTCVEGYLGTRCDKRNKCLLDGGNEFCRESTCVTDFERNSIYCVCSEGEYFDYSTRECISVDLCRLVVCNSNELCRNGRCECQNGFILNPETKTCEPNFCTVFGCPDGDMVCEENKANPEAFYCQCGEGKTFNGVTCEAAACQFPSLNGCEQECYENEDGYSCKCHPPFILKNDNQTCEYTGSSTCVNTTCDSGKCVVDGDTETCLCPSGYVERKGKCIDLCAANELPSGLCPNDECVSDGEKGFKCLCTGRYQYARDKVTCTVRKMCAPGEAGQKQCHEKQAICIEDSNGEDGFYCHCPYGYVEKENGQCKKICDIDENQKTCSKLGATCSVDENFDLSCNCPPTFTTGKGGSCNKLAEFSFLITLPLDYYTYEERMRKGSSRRRRSISEMAIDHHSMQVDVAKSMSLLFGGFQNANVLNCRNMGNYLLCKIEVQLSYVSEEENFNRLLIPSSCIYNESIAAETCLLPPSLVLSKKKIPSEVSFKKTDPCDEDIKVDLCGETTTCESSEDGFTCSCKRGFRLRSKVYPTDNARTFIESCKDIDECSEGNPCPPSTTCTNTIGSYQCSCLPGYRQSNQTSDNGCIELCDPNPCVHGQCRKSGDHEFECSCEAGYIGALCNFEDKNYKGAKMNTVIVGVVLGGILLVTILLFIASVTRLRKKKFLDEPSQILYSTEMTERRPVRLSAANPAFDRD